MMAIHIEQVMEYLDTHPLGLHEGDFESFLKIIHAIFTESNPVDSQQLRQNYEKLDGIVSHLTFAEVDAVDALVCDLCFEHEQLGFEYGMIVGMQLISRLFGLL